MTLEAAYNIIRLRIKTHPMAIKEDVEAFNTIMGFVKNNNTALIENNDLMIKFYILTYGNSLKDYNTTVFDKTHQKEFHKKFALPISNFFKDFQDLLNNSELYKLFYESETEPKHPLLSTPEEDKKDLEKVSLMITNAEENNMLLDGPYKYDVVVNNLTTQFNQFINDHENV